MSSQRMKFPAAALLPKGGEIYCHVFENSFTGLARNLFWSITVAFEPIEFDDYRHECSMVSEWITWPVRNWRELDGRHFETDGEDGIESSFYLNEHHTSTHTRVALRYRHANVFSVRMSMLVDFQGYYGDDEIPAMSIDAEVDVPFIGLVVMPDNLFPKPATTFELRKVASEFADLSAYEEPAPWNSRSSIFRPLSREEPPTR